MKSLSLVPGAISLRRVVAAVLPLLGTASALAGCSDASTGAAPIESPHSFVVHGKLTLTPPAISPDVPSSEDFVVRLDPDRGLLTVGGPSFAAQAGTQNNSGSSFDATGPLAIPLADLTCGSMTNYTKFHLVLDGADMTGTATGRAEVARSDVIDLSDAVLTMTGRPDDVAPTLGPDQGDFDPLAGLLLPASEPLPSNVAVSLVTGTETVPLEPSVAAGTGGLVVGFGKGETALRYATTYQVTASAGWMDLAGNPGAALPHILTIAAPALVAEDGFEAGAATVGGARVVDATILPPITGQRSVALVVDRGSPQDDVSPVLIGSQRLTVRLAVSAGDTAVRFSVRPFGRVLGSVSTFRASFRAAAPGGAIVGVKLPDTETLGTMATVGAGATPILLGAVRTIEMPLPAGTVDEIIFDANVANPDLGCGPPPDEVNYLLDDLRVE